MSNTRYTLIITKFDKYIRATQSYYFYYAADRDKKVKELTADSKYKVIYTNTFKDQAKRNFLIIELTND